MCDWCREAHPQLTVLPCHVLPTAGDYNDRAIDYTRQLACKQCPTGTTTAGVESDSDTDCNCECPL